MASNERRLSDILYTIVEVKKYTWDGSLAQQLTAALRSIYEQAGRNKALFWMVCEEMAIACRTKGAAIRLLPFFMGEMKEIFPPPVFESSWVWYESPEEWIDALTEEGYDTSHLGNILFPWE